MTKKQAIEILIARRDTMEYVTDNDNEAFDMAIKELEKPKIGKWIPESAVRIKGLRVSARPDCCYCSVCKDFFTQDYEYMKYCPNCGARLKLNKAWVEWADKIYKRRSAKE